MVSGSPMIRRIKRERQLSFLSRLPCRGRIRFVFIFIALVILLSRVTSVVKSLDIPFSVSAQDKSYDSTVSGRVTDKSKKRGIFPAADVGQLLLNNPVCLSYNRIDAFFENESLTVITSTDTALQRYLSRLLKQHRPLYGGIVVMEPGTGRIRALVSYVNDSMADPGGNLCLRALFPAASVFKTITAAAAIGFADYTADCITDHRGRTSTLYKSQIKAQPEGAVELTLAEAYARSINAVFGRIGIYHVGSAELMKTARAFGFNLTLPGDLYCDISNVSPPDSEYALAELASGFNQSTTISPLHGALIASCIAEGGAMPYPSLLDTVIRKRDGTVLYISEKKTWLKPITTGTADELQKIMHAVVRYGTASRHFRNIVNSKKFDDFAYGGKTGSIDKKGVGRVDWFVGYAAHQQKVDERVAVAVLTVHGAYWTVHSSHLAAEAIRIYIESIQKKRNIELVDAPVKTPIDTTVSDSTISELTNPQ